MYKQIYRSFSVMTLLMLWLIGTILPVSAQSTPSTSSNSSSNGPLQVTATTDGIAVEWHTTTANRSVSAASALANLPTIEYNGYDLPMQLITLEVPDGSDATPEISRLLSTDWSGELQIAEQQLPQALDFVPNPDLMPKASYDLPSSPIFIWREVRIRGQRIIVVAISPIYEEDGVVKFATDFNTKMTNVSPAPDARSLFSAEVARSGPARSGAILNAPAPSNAAAQRGGIKIYVSNGGMQHITGQELSDVGIDISTLDPADLLLEFNGSAVALEIQDTNNNDKIDADEEIRFFSSTPGDRWNAKNVYWLSVVSLIYSPRMSSRSTESSGAALRTTGRQSGTWSDNQIYESLQSGPDGDHWFVTSMKGDPSQQGNPSSYPQVTAKLNHTLPLADAEDSTFRLTGNVFMRAAYELSIQLGGETQTVEWNSVGANNQFFENWEETISTSAKAEELVITLIPGNTRNGARLDKIYWDRSVFLNFNGDGAFFSGVDGTWRYLLTNAPSGSGLYDVSDPLKPVILEVESGNNITFEDGPEAKDYVLVGPGTLHKPTLEAFSPLTFNTSMGADAVYIAPSIFHDALAPLLAHRESQGYQTILVDPQDAYDAWNYGHISADAIRDMLRYAVASWNPAPISVVMIGDTTWDPHNYQGFNNESFVPPYLAKVDPWLGETACENCYVQLDGDNPLDSAVDPDFGLDLFIGRFPVKSASETASVVSKILRYETGASSRTDWLSKSVFIADDYHRPDGTFDSAGDFGHFSDEAITLQPDGINSERLYYSPQYSGTDEPWREPDAQQARLRTIELLNDGAGLVTYNGHSHHWQWAVTDITQPDPRLFGLFDVDVLENRDELFIALEMTCYTAQFQKPANSGTTLDERIFLHPNGGAAALWGPAGLSVAHGHDWLQIGFHKALWAAEPQSATMGELTAAGYLDLVANGSSCCLDPLQTYLILGDPLTKVRAVPVGDVPAIASPDTTNNIYLPSVTK